MKHPLLKNLRAEWEQDFANPLNMGCYMPDDELMGIMERYRSYAANQNEDYQSGGGCLRFSLSFLAFRVHLKEAREALSIAVAISQEVLQRVDRETLLPISERDTGWLLKDGYIAMVAAQSALEPVTQPDRALLAEGAKVSLQSLRATKMFGELERGHLMKTVVMALAAQDLPLARELMELRKSMPEQQAKWLKAICKYAEQEGEPGVGGGRIVIRHPKAIEAFFELYNMLRLPDIPKIKEQYGERPIGRSPEVYLLTWVYLFSVEPIPPETVDWELLSELMIGH